MRDAARTKLDSFGVVQGTCGARNFDRPGNSTNLAFETWDSTGSKWWTRFTLEG